jgi:hypothetical protein
MFRFIQKIRARSHWDPISPAEYQQLAYQQGTSFVGHPDVCSFVADTIELSLDYFGYRNAAHELVAAVPVWNDHYVAGSRDYLLRNGLKGIVDFGSGGLIVPNRTESPLYLPYSADNLLDVNLPEQHNFRQKRKMKYQAALARPLADHSKKFRYNQNRSLRQFLDAGGEVFDATALDNDEFAHHYHRLFRKRWNFAAAGKTNTSRMLTALKPMQFGQGLKMNGRIIALQHIYCVENQDYAYYEYINAGIDTDYQDYSVGSLLCYLNLRAAEEKAAYSGKPYLYSFGFMDTDYKSIWCRPQRMFRV